jgi:hypothetical protein
MLYYLMIISLDFSEISPVFIRLCNRKKSDTKVSTTNQYFMCFYLLYFAVDIFVNPLLIGISTNLITQGLLFTLTWV